MSDKEASKSICPKCRHQAHGVGCLNMESDGECSCKYYALPDTATGERSGESDVSDVREVLENAIWDGQALNVLCRAFMGEKLTEADKDLFDEWKFNHSSDDVLRLASKSGFAAQLTDLTAKLQSVESERDRPVDMLLFCPNCGEQHIDKPESDVCQECGRSEIDHLRSGYDSFACPSFKAWLNPPHKSHRCNFCNHVWRPADVPTNGVFEVLTQGERDGIARPRYFATKKDFDDAVEATTATLRTSLESLRAVIGKAERIEFGDGGYISRVGDTYEAVARVYGFDGRLLSRKGRSCDTIDEAISFVEGERKENGES